LTRGNKNAVPGMHDEEKTGDSISKEWAKNA
jgi:hypothetical protein